MSGTTAATAAASKFLKFVDASPTHFHCVNTIKNVLVAHGFTELKENAHWALTRGGKYFYTRNQSTIAAFAVGGKFQAGNGFALVGAHTDSPNFVLKPVSATSAYGYTQIGVQTYGGGLWHTWFDRDLTVAGRVIVASAANAGAATSRLVHIQRPILRIPSLCIHLDRSQNESFAPNLERHLLPIISTAVRDQLEGLAPAAGAAAPTHHPVLLKLLADELKCDVNDIRTFELSVCDTQPAALGGAHNEFVFAPRLDNQMSCFQGVEALVAADVAETPHVQALVCFDNEEVGSNSAHGAACPIVEELLARVTRAFAAPDAALGELNAFAVRRSFMISADMAHAVHPSYADKHEAKHQPAIHGGPVIKYNANQRYATTAPTSFMLKELARRHSLPLQEFVVRNDSACGSTIGPIMSARTGIRTVDIGCPQLAMHSIRECCGTTTVAQGIALFKAFYEEFSAVDESIQTMN